MLPLNTPFWGLPCGVPRFWRLRIAKDFKKPKYYIGQTVLHRTEIRGKEITSHVDVLGIFWTTHDWQYLVNLPENHPLSEDGEEQWVWADDSEITLP